MIIGNINNAQLNNFWNINPSTYSKIKYISKKILFFAFIFFQICLITYRLHAQISGYIHIKRNKYLGSEESYLEDNYNYKRELGIGNNNSTIEDDIKEEMKNGYSFIINLTSNEYIGNYTQLSLKDNDFFSEKIDEGIAEIFFHKTKDNLNSLPLIAKARINLFKMDIIIKEGKYMDKFLKLNSSFYISKDIIKYLDYNTMTITNINKKISIYKTKFLLGKKKEIISQANLTLLLKKEEYVYSPTFKKKNFSPFYNVKLIIKSNELNVSISTKINNNENLSQEIRMYSFILALFGIIEIYYCSKLIMKINIQREIANKLSIITIAINCCLKLVICIVHFFLSVSTIDEDISYQFGVISVIYFFSFVGFELKLLLLVFRIKNESGVNRDIYRRRLISLYLMFYICFSFIFFNIKGCVTDFYLILIVYTLSWLSQIILSYCKNSRPPMPRLYIVWLSLSRLFFPIYIKGYKNNFFDLRPSYFKIGILVFIIFAEAIILILQKSLGARIIVPKKFRKQNQVFDYYKDRVNIEKHVSQNPICVICLENLNVDVDENFNKIKKKKKPKTIINKIMSILYLDILNQKIKNSIKYLEGKNPKKKYMITPCDHVFHTVCLEKWMKIKNECPYCKAEIPSID